MTKPDYKSLTGKALREPSKQTGNLDPHVLAEMAKPELENIIKTFKDTMKNNPELAKNAKIARLVKTAENSIDTIESSLPADKKPKVEATTQKVKRKMRFAEKPKPKAGTVNPKHAPI